MSIKFGDKVATPDSQTAIVMGFDKQGGRDVQVVYKDGTTQWFYSNELK